MRRHSSSRSTATRASPKGSYWCALCSSELVSGTGFPVTNLTFAPTVADGASLTLAASWSTSVHVFSGDPLEKLHRIFIVGDLAFPPSFPCDSVNYKQMSS